MVHLTIKLAEHAVNTGCALCAKRVAGPAGPQLFVEDSEEAVCRECGKLHAPALATLLDLGRVAERVGKVSRHTLVPPIGSLLDLARAAENYLYAEPRPRKKVA